jgi:hypothetical protein
MGMRLAGQVEETVISRISDGTFLAFDFGRFLRTMPTWLGPLVLFGILLLIAGGVYIANRLKEMGADDGDAGSSRDDYRERLEKKREKKLKRREGLVDKIPSGPIEPNRLPPATLRVRNRVVELSSQKELSIGKLPDNDLVISELGVSRNHAKIRPDSTGYKIYDLVSSHGTFVNNERVVQHYLRDNDRIRIGPLELLFTLKTQTR